MLKTYEPEFVKYKTHFVELTHLFGDIIVVTKHKIYGNCTGTDILEAFSERDSLWLEEKYEIIKGGFEYNEEFDEIVVPINEHENMHICGADISKYLIKVEIVGAIEDEDD